jgi:hypothetical protein
MKTDDGGEMFAGALVFLFLTIALPAFLLYGEGAAENPDNMVKFFFYAVLGFAPLFVNFVTVYLQNRGFFERHPNLKGFQYFTFHSPDQTWLGKQVPALLNRKVLFAVFFSFSMFFGAAVSVNAQFATGTPELVTGSVSPAASLGLAVEPAVSSETLFFNVGMLFGQIGLIYWLLSSRGVSPRASYIIAHVLSVILSSVEFLLYHTFRYGAVESAQSSILMQGFIYNSLTAVTHSAIPAYLIHGSGNFFSKASSSGIFTSETSILLAVVGVVLSGLASVYLLFEEFVTG